MEHPNGTLARQDFAHGHKRPKKQLGNNKKLCLAGRAISLHQAETPAEPSCEHLTGQFPSPIFWVSNRHYTDMTAL